jgi:hypothetical protein
MIVFTVKSSNYIVIIYMLLIQEKKVSTAVPSSKLLIPIKSIDIYRAFP